MIWQLQEAKQKFSKLVRSALNEGPQMVTRHGEEVVVVLSAQEYWRLTAKASDFKTFLLSGPSFDDLKIERSRERTRIVEL